MVQLSSESNSSSASRPMVKALFVSTCLLSIVSWYTTEQGMALYLSPWFALLASLGVQSALVMVAWLIGFSKSNRLLLSAVYAITAMVSVAFSYVSLYTWFAGKERPAIVERQLYDSITASSGQADQLLAGSIAEARKHVLALDEMTTAEKSHGFISRAQDSDPYLSKVREAVAREAQSYGNAYKEGSGEGLRYTAFDRHAKLARASLDQLVAAQKSLADFRSQARPNEPSEQQIRKYRAVYDSIPWTQLDEQLHASKTERPPVPAYSENVDRTSSGQEDLMLAFTELFTAPTARHIFSFLLAAFIDIIVFLLAYASGPHFFGAPEQRWRSASAVLDGVDPQVFTRDLLAKVTAGAGGLPRIDFDGLTPGERQLCLLLISRNGATLAEEGGRQFYLLNPETHRELVESLDARSMPLRGAHKPAQAL